MKNSLADMKKKEHLVLLWSKKCENLREFQFLFKNSEGELKEITPRNRMSFKTLIQTFFRKLVQKISLSEFSGDFIEVFGVKNIWF